MVLVQLTIIKINWFAVFLLNKRSGDAIQKYFHKWWLHPFYKHLENISNLFLHFKKCPSGKYEFYGYLIFRLLVKSWEQYFNSYTYILHKPSTKHVHYASHIRYMNRYM